MGFPPNCNRSEMGASCATVFDGFQRTVVEKHLNISNTILLKIKAKSIRATLNPLGSIPRGSLRIRHTGESRYPESPTGFRVKHGMTAKDIDDTP
jgi:hypothetical protein